jgi:hypothetical protein
MIFDPVYAQGYSTGAAHYSSDVFVQSRLMIEGDDWTSIFC